MTIAPETTAATVWRPDAPVDAGLTLSILRHGAHDPCQMRTADGATWRTSRMPSGSATQRITQVSGDEIAVQAWGPGADELIAAVPELLGRDDPVDTFDPLVPIVAEAHHRFPGLRIPRTGRLLESLVPAILEQKVVGLDAFAAWRRLVMKFGEPAPGPGPAGLRVLPTADAWRMIPSWEWHRAGVDPRRSRTVMVALSRIDTLERAVDSGLEPAEVYRMLRSLPGIGIWTAAEVGYRVLGDPDAIPIGDYHLAPLVSFALAGRTVADHEVEEFCEPWRPHRFRVIRLLELAGATPPRRGHRMSRVDHRRF